MKNVKLKNAYVEVAGQSGKSYGGNQGWFSGATVRGYGCGLIGASDILIYMGSKQGAYIKESVYKDYVSALGKKYFPLLPKAGISGWLLAIGLRRCCGKYRLPYKVRWGVRKRKILSAIEEMLGRDIPVILSVGPNFPILWGRKGVGLYRCNGRGAYTKVQDIRAHYVVVTGMMEGWLRISTWGKEYYLNWEEYKRYIDKYSCSLFSNICYIK